MQIWHLPALAGCLVGGLNKRTIAALAQKPIIQFLLICLWHILSCSPFAGATESMHKPFKKTPGFPAAFHLTQTDRIPTDFHSQLLWGLFFLALVLQAGEPHTELGPLLSWGTSVTEISLLILDHRSQV